MLQRLALVGKLIDFGCRGCGKNIGKFMLRPYGYALFLYLRLEKAYKS